MHSLISSFVVVATGWTGFVVVAGVVDMGTSHKIPWYPAGQLVQCIPSTDFELLAFALASCMTGASPNTQIAPNVAHGNTQSPCCCSSTTLVCAFTNDDDVISANSENNVVAFIIMIALRLKLLSVGNRGKDASVCVSDKVNTRCVHDRRCVTTRIDQATRTLMKNV